MNLFKNILNSIKKRQLEFKERKEFLEMVEQKAKPIRRAAYMQQMLKEVVSEGIEKAKEDSLLKKPQQKKTEQDFGFESLNDPFKYINRQNKKNEK